MAGGVNVAHTAHRAAVALRRGDGICQERLAVEMYAEAAARLEACRQAQGCPLVSMTACYRICARTCANSWNPARAIRLLGANRARLRYTRAACSYSPTE